MPSLRIHELRGGIRQRLVLAVHVHDHEAVAQVLALLEGRVVERLEVGDAEGRRLGNHDERRLVDLAQRVEGGLEVGQ